MSLLIYNGLKELSIKGLKGKALYRTLIINQKNFIEWCENNGKSYTGPNGPAIKQADLNELKRLESLGG